MRLAQVVKHNLFALIPPEQIDTDPGLAADDQIMAHPKTRKALERIQYIKALSGVG